MLNEAEIEEAWLRLDAAVERKRTDAYCLRLWSLFIRVRDGKRCVICREGGGLFAHHIIRKSLLPLARFDPGNGISMCKACHREPHAFFNRRPDLNLPMDAEGGENIDLMIALFRTLLEDAVERELLCDRYYFVGDEVLRTFKRFQTIPKHRQFPGTRLEQAYLIWRQTPPVVLPALLRANGLELPDDFLQLGTMTEATVEGGGNP
jgi:hypothetical protein